jgi:Fe-S cluster assembly iron-binding protein IscA
MHISGLPFRQIADERDTSEEINAMTQPTAASMIPNIKSNSCPALQRTDRQCLDEQLPGIEVTAKAALSIREYLQGKDSLPIRIFLTIGSCGMQSFGIHLEALQPSDEIFEHDGFTYIVERRLLKQYGPIKIDSDGISFRLSGKGISPLTGCGTCAFQCGIRGQARCTGVCISCEAPCPTGLKIRARRDKRKATWLCSDFSTRGESYR